MEKAHSGRVALITGSAQGIGKAIAHRLGREGATLAIADLLEDMAEQTAKELAAELGVPTASFGMDVSKSATVDAAFAAVEQKLGPVDILVNNAGITRDNILLRMKDEDWDKVIGINLTGAFHCARAAIKNMMKRRWGRIVNISSVVGMLGNAGQVNYAATKAGLFGLSNTIAKEYAERGITVNCVAPGYIQTRMTDELTEQVREYWMTKIPMRRFGKPEEIAAVVSFLCGEEAGYITGEIIRVDGGVLID